MKITHKVKRVVAAFNDKPEKFVYPVEIAEVMGTGGNGVLITIKAIIKRLLLAGYLVKMDAVEIIRDKHNCKPRLYRLSKTGRQLALKHKLEGFGNFGKRMFMIVPK